MNKIFKNIWNHFRGQVVCVSEKSASHDHSSAGETVDSTSKATGVTKTFVLSGISCAMLMALTAAQAAQAAINPDLWGQEQGVIAQSVNRELSHTIGANYGHISDWKGWNDTKKNVITFTAKGSLVGGVFWESTDGNGTPVVHGSIGKSGMARHWAVINEGRFVDSKVPVLGKPQLGTTNWFHKFANRQGAVFDVYDLRSSEVLNQSQDFRVEALHLQAGGQLENSGVMNIGELRVGIKADSTVFTKNQVTDNGQGGLGLPEVVYDDLVQTSVTNTGTINVSKNAHLSAALTNGADAAFNVTNGLVVTQNVQNQGTITASTADFQQAFDNLGTASKLNVTGDATMASLKNEGDVKANTLGVSGHVENKGSIVLQGNFNANALNNTGTAATLQAQAVTLTTRLSNDNKVTAQSVTAAEIANNANAQMTVTGDVLADKLTNGAGASVSGAHFTSSGAVVNDGTLTETASDGESLFGFLTNSGTVKLAHLTKIEQLTNNKTGKVEGGAAVNVTGALTNAGALGQNPARLASLTVGTSADNSGQIYVKTANVTGLTNQAAGNLDVEGLLTLNGEVQNLGAVTAGQIVANGKVTNANVITTGTAGASTFADVANTGTITLGSDATMTSLDNSAANAKIAGVGNLTVNGALTNAGEIGSAQGRLTNVQATGLANNTGKIYAGSASFNADLTNGAAAELDVSGQLSVSTATNDGTVKAGTVAVTQRLTNNNALNASTVNAGTATIVNEKQLTVTSALNAQTLNNGINGQLNAGQVAVGSLTNAGTVTLTGSQVSTIQTLDNTRAEAVFNGAGAVNVTGNLTNKGVIDQKKTMDLTVAGVADNQKTLNAKSADLGKLNNVGTVDVTNTLTVKTAFSNSDTGTINAGNVHVGTGTNQGTLNVTGTMTVAGGQFTHQQGNIAATTLKLDQGEFVVGANAAANVTVNNLESVNQSTLENAGALTIGHIGTTDGLTYKQTGGSLTVTDKSFFSNSTLNISGGKLTRLDPGHNTFGQGNTVNLSGTKAGGPQADGTGKLDPTNWTNGYTYAHVGLLDSGSTVTINKGAILEADDINLTSKSLTLNGGVLASDMSSFFVSVTEDFFTVDTGEANKLPTTVLGTKDVGALEESFGKYLTVGNAGGTLVLTDEYVYLDAVASANKKLGEVFSGKDMHVVFTGQVADPTTRDNNFYHQTFADLKAEQKPDSKFNTPGLVFSNMAYMNKTDANGVGRNQLIIGSTGTSVGENALLLDLNIGFMNVGEASEVVVQDGKTFVLTGKKDGIELVNNAQGKVTVKGVNSVFKLGNQGVADVKGHLGTLAVENQGAFKAVKGEYSLDNLQLVNGSGEVMADAILNVAALSDAQGVTELTNRGKLNLTGSGETIFNGAVTNEGTLAVKANATINGKFVNTNGGLATFDQLSFGGKALTNTANSKLVAEKGWNVLANADVTSDGRLISYGDNTVAGNLTLGKTGYVVAQGHTTISEGGTLTMQGKGLYEQLTIADGTVDVQNSTLFVENALTVQGTGALLSNGPATIVALSINTEGTTRFGPGHSLKLGAVAVDRFERESASEIKGQDYRKKPVMTYLYGGGEMNALTDNRQFAYSVDESSLGGYLNNGEILEGGDHEAGYDYQYDTFRIEDVTLANGATFTVNSDWYLLAGTHFTMNAGTSFAAEDVIFQNSILQTNFIVKGTVNANGTASYSNLVMGDQGSYLLGGTDKGSILTLLGGTYTVKTGAQSTFDTLLTTHPEVAQSTGKIDNQGTLTLGGGTLGQGASIENAGVLNITDTLNVAGKLTATAGRISGKVLVVSGTGEVSLAGTNIDGLKTIRNEGHLTLDDAKRFGAGNTYVHSGNATLTTNGTWFDGTNLEFTDGAVFNTDSVNRKTLGNNTVVISGGTPANITNGKPNTGTFDGMTKVTVHTLDKAGSITVKEGGYLDVKALSGQANVLVEEGGVLGLAIADLTKFYLGGSTIDKDQNVEIESDKFGAAHFVGDKLNGIRFDGANVELKSKKDKETLATIVTVADGLSGMGNVTTVFNGQVEGAASNDTFTLSAIAELFAEQAGKDSPVNNPGVVLTGYSLDAGNASEIFFSKEDGRTHAVAGSVGFRSIKNTDKVTVESGFTTSLTGYEGTLDWSDAQRLVVSSSANKGGDIEVLNGRVIFGNGATKAQNVGWVDNLTSAADGRVQVKHFNLGVKHAALSGDTAIMANASLTAQSLEFGKGATLKNDGLLTVGTDAADEVLTVLGTLESTGTLDLSKIETVNIGAAEAAGAQSIVNRGQATYGNVAVHKGGRLENFGTEKGGDLTVATGAVHQTSGTSTWNNVAVAEGAQDIWGSDAGNDTVKVTVNDGGKYLNAGTLNATKAETAEFKGVMETSGTASFNALTVNGTLTVKDGSVGATQLTAQKGSALSVEKGVMALNGMSVDDARGATQKNAVLGLGGTLNLEGSSLVVGTKDQATAVEAGDVYFGTDSALVVDTSRLTADHLIKGSGKLTVKKGSELVVTNASWGKHVLIADGFDVSGVEEGAWDGDDFVNKTKIYMDYVFKDGKLILQVGKPGDTAIGSLSKDFIAPNVINGLIDTEEGAAIRDVNSPFADVAFIDRMLDVNFVGKDAEGNLNLANSLEKMNSVLGFNAATGMDAYAHAMVGDKMDRIDRRAQASVGLDERSFWVDVIGSKTKADGLGFANGEAGFNADNHGLIFGVDMPVRNDLRIGAAFNYVDGDVESEGNVISTKTDAQTFGLTVYGAYEFGDFRLLGQVGYDRTKGEAEQNFTDVQSNGYKVTGDTNAKIFSLGLTGEFEKRLGSFTFVPHAGVRLAHADHDGFDTYINGKKAFGNKVEATDIVQLPIGVGVKGHVDAKGWTLVPTADVSLVPQFGDVDNRVTVSATNFAGTDSYDYDVAGDFVGKLHLGLAGEKDAHRFGVSLDVSAGDKGARSTGVTLDYRLTF